MVLIEKRKNARKKLFCLLQGFDAIFYSLNWGYTQTQTQRKFNDKPLILHSNTLKEQQGLNLQQIQSFGHLTVLRAFVVLGPYLNTTESPSEYDFTFTHVTLTSTSGHTLKLFTERSLMEQSRLK